MSTAIWHTGDVFDVMATLPPESVDLVLTSPPFLALRSYLPADHPDKDKEIGSEANPAEFLDVLLALTSEWGRLLTPHGSIAVELGDTYSGTGGGTRPVHNPNDAHKFGALTDSGEVAVSSGDGWPLAKSLALIPELYRIGLAYGINPLTGAESPAGRWRVRNVVRWHRPNPPVGALGDKFRPATTDMVIACRSDKRWFDLDAVRTAHNVDPTGYSGNGYTKGNPSGEGRDNAMPGNPAGAPPLDTWTIPTQPYKGAHYATWPAELCRIPVESMCPRHVCTVCGEPRRRIAGEPTYVGAKSGEPYEAEVWASGRGEGLHAHSNKRPDERARRLPGPDDWSDCGHDSWRPGTVLDPFAGTGTTLAVATGHSRNAIGIDLDPRNHDLARDRVGMFLTSAP